MILRKRLVEILIWLSFGLQRLANRIKPAGTLLFLDVVKGTVQFLEKDEIIKSITAQRQRTAKPSQN